jgi:hypothetical protein
MINCEYRNNDEDIGCHSLPPSYMINQAANMTGKLLAARAQVNIIRSQVRNPV